MNDTIMNDLILLAALLREPAYGYALKKTAGLIFGTKTMHSNVVYPVLKKFVQNGWVEVSSAPGEKGQTRKQYLITAVGRKYLIEHLAVFGEEDAADDGAFLFRVALFDILPTEKRRAIVDARRSFVSARAIQLAKLHEATRPESFGGVALERLRNVVADELRWLRKLDRNLQTNKGDAKCKQQLTHQAIARRS